MSTQEQKDKLRVYEYAKSLNMSSKEIITILKRLDVPVNNHMSVMENDAVSKVEKFFKDIKSNAEDKHVNATTKNTSADSTRPKIQQEKQVGMDTKTQNNSNSGNNKPQNGSSNSNRSNSSSSQSSNRPSTGSNNSSSRTSSTSGQSSRQPSSASRPPSQSSSQNRQPSGQVRSAGSTGGNSSTSSNGNRNASGGAGNGNAGPKRNNSTGGGQGGGNRSGGGGGNRYGSNNGNRNNNGRGGKGRGKNQYSNQPPREKIDNTPKKIIVRGEMTVGETAKLLHKDASEVIKKLITSGVMATINQELDLDTIQLLASDYGVEVEIKIAVEDDRFETVEEVDDEADLSTRPPVVTIMGHVDHGKTTLLDAIRSTNVTGGEAGGITQHIGAYQVEINKKKITFLDTPGHEAFTAMRARGAQVTDITIIVVAADDGVMPQTVEAINHAKAAGLPIIVAVNKIDKPGANPDKVKQELTEYELVPEEWGGDTIFVNVSAKKRNGIEDLLEMILLVAEVNDYKANPDKRARGAVIEAELDKGRGPVVRVLVQNGTLKVGDAFVAGNCFGRIRAMVSDKGRRLKEAGPSTPVEITGLTEVPLAGDPFMVFEDERKARSIADKRAITHRQSELGANTRVTLDDLFQHIKDGEIKDLNVIIKGDVQGSVEALKGSLEKIEVEGVRVKIIHRGVGAINDSDIILAAASNAIVIGFNVRPDSQATQTAEQEKVDIRLHRVIYNAIEEIEQAMKGMLDPEYKEVVVGHAEVRSVFKISKVGAIAGCMVTSGKMVRAAESRLIRDGIVIFEGKLDSLKRFKDDAKEVAQGYECGITLDGYNDLKEGDIIEAFIMETVER
ncbi:translation initiation factor IF-2 [Paenibacillus sp. SORGH_AS306]|uniref:translation initiation factor IF-2 n=1 Tax=unclassified Paenibacillus TaxID=185978 RepID=UPI002786D242|nr:MULTISPECIES: translation initiation factor IF-2 [unclassified Paenibacillus]MDQ1233704.1 translation initiation factor IF-2 [Paenibacillus sp. SORGH_AS_0306]MDR6110745.1 translation initiation factor IF-2 [Paenibacillus sp. SORGH_AS_0338]